MKAVPLHLANVAPPAPGQAPNETPATVKVGVRVLRGDETIDVYEKAQQYARDHGVPEWKEDHPICRQFEMACSVLHAVCSVDQITGAPMGDGEEPEPFFDSVDQILSSKLIGTDNIVYLHEQWVQWQDERSPRFQKMTPDQAIAMVVADMGAPDSTESPLVSLPHASLVSCVRILGRLLLDSPTGKSLSGSRDGGSSESLTRSLIQTGLEAGAGAGAEPK